MKELEPQLVVDAMLYSTEKGGRILPAVGSYLACVCMTRPDGLAANWEGRLLLKDSPMLPGESRRIGIAFLSGDKAADDLRAAGTFFLWDGRIIGEAVVVS